MIKVNACKTAKLPLDDGAHIWALYLLSHVSPHY